MELLTGKSRNQRILWVYFVFCLCHNDHRLKVKGQSNLQPVVVTAVSRGGYQNARSRGRLINNDIKVSHRPNGAFVLSGVS